MTGHIGRGWRPRLFLRALRKDMESPPGSLSYRPTIGGACGMYRPSIGLYRPSNGL